MDPNLLVSVIKSQAGTLSKAILEGVMNSIDAGASRVDVTLSFDKFVIEDNGRGFAGEKQIQEWFGRFGTPHEEGDSVFGKYRMGRGQMFAFAINTWTSGKFKMEVDIEKDGLSYRLSTPSEPFDGCRVEGALYRELRDYEIQDLLSELKKYVAYTPRPVYVNGQLYGAPAQRLKSWTFEDEHAWYRVNPDSDEMDIYNQGVFVESKSSWRTGSGGIVVSKKRLEVNFARNSILEDRCSEWTEISARLQSLVLKKLMDAKKLNDDERKFLARRLNLILRIFGSDCGKIKIITDPSGRHISLNDLKSFRRFVYVADEPSLACSAHTSGELFVVTEKLLTRFGAHDINEWLVKMGESGFLMAGYELIQADKIKHYGFGGADEMKFSDLKPKEKAALKALGFANQEIGKNMVVAGLSSSVRNLLIGKHAKNSFVAWTDGRTYITANKRFLKLFDSGLDGTLEWLNTLVHEYMHDTDDSESHSHGEVFYRKFHDAVFTASSLKIGSLAQATLVEYVKALKESGLKRPHKLTRQLKPLIH